jgi:predicted DNA-binding protein with PD1-like motif
MLGASKKLELSFYNLAGKEYEKHEFNENMEILNAGGNIGQFEGKPVIHLHGSFGRQDLSTLGGHVHKLVANATVEVVLHKIDGNMEREYNKSVGLNTLKSNFNMEENKEIKPRTSPKDFFINLLSMAALYMSAGSFIALVFQYINIFFPDALEVRGYGNPLQGAYSIIRFAVSTLIVSFPIYLTTLWFMGKEYITLPEKRNLRIRKWLIYFTLFLTALIIMGDLIALVNTFLGGEITMRFVLKVLTVFAVTGSIFTYYLSDVRKYKTE